MPNDRSMPRGCGFVITPAGRHDLAELETCPCTVKVFVGGELICPECETVWGLQRQIASGLFGTSDWKR